MLMTFARNIGWCPKSLARVALVMFAPATQNQDITKHRFKKSSSAEMRAMYGGMNLFQRLRSVSRAATGAAFFRTSHQITLREARQ
jgi:hypothetical protein